MSPRAVVQHRASAPPGEQWIVAWKLECMHAPVATAFPTEREARRVADALGGLIGPDFAWPMRKGRYKHLGIAIDMTTLPEDSVPDSTPVVRIGIGDEPGMGHTVAYVQFMLDEARSMHAALSEAIERVEAMGT